MRQVVNPIVRAIRDSIVRGGGAAPFDIASTNPSAYYDRTVLATLFQDYQGATPVTAGSQPIGLGLDQSGGGNNQIQATAGKRPILMQSPAGGVRNLLTYTEDFSNAAWPTTNWTITPNDIPSPTGSADKLYSAAQANLQRFFTAAGTSYTYTIVAKAGTLDPIFILYNAVTGIELSRQNWAQGEDTTDGFKKFVMSASSVITVGDSMYIYYGAVGQPVEGLYFWIDYAQLELGSTATDYQKVTNQYTVTEEGVPSVWRAKFDAVDDDLVATFPSSLGAGCTVCRSLPGTGASITTGVTLTATYTDNVDAHALLIYTAAQWAALDAGQIADITTWLNGRAGL